MTRKSRTRMEVIPSEKPRSPKFSKKLIPLALVLVIFLMLVLATIATKNILPIWQYALGLTILALIIVWVMLKKPAPTAERTEESTKRNYFGMLPTLIVIALIVLGIWWLNSATSETPNKVYTGKMLKPLVSGNCDDKDDRLTCTGPWTLTLPGDQAIEWVRIWQQRGKNSLTKNMSVVSGRWQIDIFQEYRTCTPVQTAPTPRYKAAIFYDGISDFACDGTGGVEAPTEENGITQEPALYIGMPWKFWDPNKDSPEVLVGENKVSHGTVKTDRIFVFGLPLEIRFGLPIEKTVIDRIEIKYKK